MKYNLEPIRGILVDSLKASYESIEEHVSTDIRHTALLSTQGQYFIYLSATIWKMLTFYLKLD